MTYDFECLDKDCLKKFDISCSISEYDEKKLKLKCPECGSKNVSRLLLSVGTGLIFKGSGFHVNDYPKKGNR